jgi:hypothetical protein
MTTKLSCELVDGLMPAEKIARFKAADGKFDEVFVSTENLDNNSLVVNVIAQMEGRALIELPRESASGRWRVWVASSSIGA